MFARGSRYETVPNALYSAPNGRVVPFKLLRPIPDLSDTPRQEHVVAEGDRLDLVANRYYRDPEQYWRICDANSALWPDDLVATLGRRLRIPVAMG